MGDHFVLLVDCLITESTLEAAIDSRNRMMQAAVPPTDGNKTVDDTAFGDLSSRGRIVECRICHDEDADSNMETPCSCCGSLKYAHRRCVQRWCNEKGDKTCEICHQQFKPGYTAPPPLFQLGRIPLNFRGNWGISRRELTDARVITVIPANHGLLDDDYPVSSTRSLLCCRAVALIFMVLLVIRHTLPIILGGSSEYTLPLFTLLLLRTAGIILPINVAVKAAAACQRHRNQQGSANSPTLSDDEETEDSSSEDGFPLAMLALEATYLCRPDKHHKVCD